jgi:hypothetical protein
MQRIIYSGMRQACSALFYPGNAARTCCADPAAPLQAAGVPLALRAVPEAAPAQHAAARSPWWDLYVAAAAGGAENSGKGCHGGQVISPLGVWHCCLQLAHMRSGSFRPPFDFHSLFVHMLLVRASTGCWAPAAVPAGVDAAAALADWAATLTCRSDFMLNDLKLHDSSPLRALLLLLLLSCSNTACRHHTHAEAYALDARRALLMPACCDASCCYALLLIFRPTAITHLPSDI